MKYHVSAWLPDAESGGMPIIQEFHFDDESEAMEFYEKWEDDPDRREFSIAYDRQFGYPYSYYEDDEGNQFYWDGSPMHDDEGNQLYPNGNPFFDEEGERLDPEGHEIFHNGFYYESHYDALIQAGDYENALEYAVNDEEREEVMMLMESSESSVFDEDDQDDDDDSEDFIDDPYPDDPF